MRKVVNYKILKDESSFGLGVEVMDFLSKGWELNGSPYYSKSDHCQCMVMYETPEESVPTHDNIRRIVTEEESNESPEV